MHTHTRHHCFQVPCAPPQAATAVPAGTPEVSLDDRRQKHVSFDSSSLMRSQTLSTMDESSFQRALAAHTHVIPDGSFGPTTMVTLWRYQIAQGLPATGYADDATKKAVGMSLAA